MEAFRSAGRPQPLWAVMGLGAAILLPGLWVLVVAHSFAGFWLLVLAPLCWVSYRGQEQRFIELGSEEIRFRDGNQAGEVRVPVSRIAEARSYVYRDSNAETIWLLDERGKVLARIDDVYRDWPGVKRWIADQSYGGGGERVWEDDPDAASLELKWQLRDFRTIAATASAVYVFFGFLCVEGVTPPWAIVDASNGAPVLWWQTGVVLTLFTVIAFWRRTGTGTKALFLLGNILMSFWLSPCVACLLDRSPPTTVRVPVLGRHTFESGLLRIYEVDTPPFPVEVSLNSGTKTTFSVTLSTYDALAAPGSHLIAITGNGWKRAVAEGELDEHARRSIADYDQQKAALLAEQKQRAAASAVAHHQSNVDWQREMEAHLAPQQPVVILEAIDLAKGGDTEDAPELAVAAKRLEVLSRCAHARLELMSKMAFDPIRQQLCIGRRFDDADKARAWQAKVQHCAPHATVEKLTVMKQKNAE